MADGQRAMVQQDLWQVVLGQHGAGNGACRFERRRQRPSVAAGIVMEVQIRVDGLELGLLELGLEAVGRQGGRDGVWRGREVPRSCHSHRRIAPSRYNS